MTRAQAVRPRHKPGALHRWLDHWPELCQSGITRRGVKLPPHLPVPRTIPGPSKDEAIALHNFLVSLCASPSRRVYTDGSLKDGLAAYAYFAQSGTETW